MLLHIRKEELSNGLNVFLKPVFRTMKISLESFKKFVQGIVDEDLKQTYTVMIPNLFAIDF
jgi:hypothetical protein